MSNTSVCGDEKRKENNVLLPAIKRNRWGKSIRHFAAWKLNLDKSFPWRGFFAQARQNQQACRINFINIFWEILVNNFSAEVRISMLTGSQIVKNQILMWVFWIRVRWVAHDRAQAKQLMRLGEWVRVNEWQERRVGEFSELIVYITYLLLTIVVLCADNQG